MSELFFLFRRGTAFWGAVYCFCLPKLLLIYLNKADNERMLPEMKLVYHGLEIQIRAGVYITDALAGMLWERS